MKVRIKKSILLEALQLVVSISPKATTQQVTNNVLIEASDSKVTFKATNFELTFLGEFEANVEEAGSICIHTSKLYNLARNFQSEEVSFESNQQNWVFITSGNTEVKLPGMDPEAFPPIEFSNLAQSFSIAAQEFKTNIDRIFFAIGENESRRNLMGFNLEVINPREISCKGADAFRISYNKITFEEDIAAVGSIIIPKKSLSEVKKIIDKVSEPIQIFFDENTFQLETGTVKFKTRLIEADYPNLSTILDTVGPNQIDLPKGELLRAVRILNTLTDDDPNAVVKLTLKPDHVVIESQKLEMGEGMDVIYTNYEGEELSIGLNIQFLLDGIQAFDSCPDEMVTFHISGAIQPLFLVSKSWPEYKTVLMPVKIKW